MNQTTMRNGHRASLRSTHPRYSHPEPSRPPMPRHPRHSASQPLSSSARREIRELLTGWVLIIIMAALWAWVAYGVIGGWEVSGFAPAAESCKTVFQHVDGHPIWVSNCENSLPRQP